MATHGTVDVWLDRVTDIALIIRKHAAETEEKRRLSPPVVDAMLQAGLYSNTAGDLPYYRWRGQGGRSRPCCGWYVGNLQRIQVPTVLRDMHTITQHAFASASRYESVGVRILRVELDWGSFALSAYTYSLCPKVIP